MKKYSLYIITIPLVTAFVVLFSWLYAKNNNDKKEQTSEKQEMTKGVATEKQDTTYYAITEDTPAYKFEDFPASKSFRGTPDPPNFKTNLEARLYKTVTIDGAKDGPNFAGAFTVIEYGCGTNCQLHTILNAKTGTVISYDELLSFYDVDYRLDSRLLVVNPKEALVENFGNEIPQYFKTKYYELTEDGLRLNKIEKN